jgi:hypothetical protein
MKSGQSHPNLQGHCWAIIDNNPEYNIFVCLFIVARAIFSYVAAVTITGERAAKNMVRLRT